MELVAQQGRFLVSEIKTRPRSIVLPLPIRRGWRNHPGSQQDDKHSRNDRVGQVPLRCHCEWSHRRRSCDDDKERERDGVAVILLV